MREWTLHVCRACGDYNLWGPEEMLHLPNQRCPGITEPGLVGQVTVVSKLEVAVRNARLGIVDPALLG
jgi:hypothetical protein